MASDNQEIKLNDHNEPSSFSALWKDLFSSPHWGGGPKQVFGQPSKLRHQLWFEVPEGFCGTHSRVGNAGPLRNVCFSAVAAGVWLTFLIADWNLICCKGPCEVKSLSRTQWLNQMSHKEQDGKIIFYDFYLLNEALNCNFTVLP